MDVKLHFLYLGSGDKKLEKECSKFIENSPNAFFQQTIAWSRVIESIGKDKCVYIIVKRGESILGIIPAYILKSQNGNIINSVPYPGPLGGVFIKENIKNREEIFAELVKGLSIISGREKCILATLISAPFTKDEKLYRKYFKPDWELENYTLYIDITRPPATNSHFRNNLNRMLKKASEQNLIVEETINLKDFNNWYLVHSNRHRQLKLEPIPKKLLYGFFKHMIPNNKGKFFVVKKGGKVTAGCFVAYHKDIVDTYIYSGDQKAYKNGAIYLLIDYIINWAKQKKFKILNWQSSKPKGGGPYNFKMQWGSRETPYFFFTKQYGPIDKILKLGKQRVQEKYKWHYVLPYSAFENSISRG